jgi:PhzF family phenazine biosynthesis protein
MTMLLHVDAFTEVPFRGNPAAVCLVDGDPDAPWMQMLAAELALPATAFVRPTGDGFALRWFSPTAELALCGHGTLATAHALWETARLPASAPARFATQAGALLATRHGQWIAIDMPAEPATPSVAPPALLDSLGVKPRAVARNRLDYLVEVDDEAAVRALAPDLHTLATVETRGVIVTAPATTAGFDFVSRFFAPRVGIPEDAVTGSAHCCLAPLWSARLRRAAVTGLQLSARGGVVRAVVKGARVRL